MKTIPLLKSLPVATLIALNILLGLYVGLYVGPYPGSGLGAAALIGALASLSLGCIGLVLAFLLRRSPAVVDQGWMRVSKLSFLVFLLIGVLNSLAIVIRTGGPTIWGDVAIATVFFVIAVSVFCLFSFLMSRLFP